MKKLLPLLILSIVSSYLFPAFSQVRDTYSDTWVAVDDLNRKSPDNSITGNMKSNKTVGLFYYIWSVETPAWPIKDISKILAGQDTWGGAPLFHHYGESLYGYYSSQDDFVIRRHMQMFADAGVDYIFLDNTNGPTNTYETTYKKIFAILDDMKAKGVKTPKVAFVVNTDMNGTIETVYSALYAQNLYSQHWFRWQGKPLILGTYNGSNSAVSNFFTFKRSWAWTSQPWFTANGGKNCWPWLDDYPQKAGRDGSGAIEQMTVTAAQHPHGQYAIGKSTGADRTQNPVYGTDGKYFGLQWDKALQVDPQMIMVTQWNEWIAQRFIKGDPNYNQPIDYMERQPISNGGSQFVDVYTPEYARDLEPMRTAYRDNMYLQMANNIRKYKGTRAFREATNPTTITMNTTFSQWSTVGPQYLDDINDVTSRNHVSFGSDLTYTNTTGRNDLDEMKISYDDTYIYFYAKTASNLTPYTDARWMNLLINSDANYSTGWEGYDYIVNNTVNSTTSTTLKKNSGGTFSWGSSQNISYVYSGNEIHVRLPASSLGINTKNTFTLDFKWVDNSIQSGDIIDLYVNGDAAPNNRYNNRYIGVGIMTPLTSWDFNTSGDMEGWDMNHNVTGVANGYVLATTVTGTDPYILSPGSLIAAASQYKYVYLNIRNYTSQTQGELYWTTSTSGAFDGTKHVLFDLPPNDGAYHDVLIDVSSIGAWADIITQLRIDPMTSGTSGQISFNHISLEKTNNLDCQGVWNGNAPSVVPSIVIIQTVGANPSCAGESITFKASPTNGGASPSYQWKSNGNNVGTDNATYTSTTLSNNAVLTCVLTSNAVCASTPKATSNSITINRTALVTPTVSIALTTGTNPSCGNDALTFTATTNNGGSTPSYQWKVNGSNQGTNSATFTSSSLTNNAIVSCVMTSNATCVSTPTATSNNITVTRTALVTPTLSIALTTGTNPSCASDAITFTATRTNGGSTPSYQWKVNGSNQGTNSATFTSSTLVNNAVVSCVMTSNATCVSTPTATSNNITVTRTPLFTPTLSIALTAGSNPSCANDALTFTVTPTNGGSTPSYQWKVNGSNQGTNSATFSSSSLTNNAIVSCVLTSNASCVITPTATSNNITVTITQTVVWYADGDGDGKGDPAETQNSCTKPSGYVSVAGDGCPTDANKISPGICGCGVAESSCTNQPQTITFVPFDGTQSLGDPDFTLSATSTSGLAITYSSSNPNVAIIVGNTVKIIGVGTTTITATQSGNAMYAASTSSQNLIISSPNQQASLQVLDGSTLLTNNGSALNIGSAALNKQTTLRTITLKNSGASSVTITNVTGSNGFSATQASPSGPIAPNQTASILIGGTPSDVTAPTTGTITIISNGTPQTFTLNVEVEVSTTTGNQSSLSASQIELFPNPTIGNVYLNFNGSFEDVEITVYSIEGKCVQQEQIETASNTKEFLSVSDLPNGIYFVEIKTKQGSTVKRLIKQ